MPSPMSRKASSSNADRKMEKSVGASTQPCLTPFVTLNDSETSPPTLTFNGNAMMNQKARCDTQLHLLDQHDGQRDNTRTPSAREAEHSLSSHKQFLQNLIDEFIYVRSSANDTTTWLRTDGHGGSSIMSTHYSGKHFHTEVWVLVRHKDEAYHRYGCDE